MTIVLNPSTPMVVGPGYKLFTDISDGPIPVDDYVSIQVSVREAFPARSLIFGTRRTDGFLTNTVVLGIDLIAHAFWITSNQGLPAAGINVDLNVAHWHANGTLVQQTGYTSGAWTWDPTGGLYLLQSYIASNLGFAVQAQLNRIEAAVRPVYSSP